MTNRQKLTELAAWMRRTYGGIGAADLLRAARAEGIRTTHNECYEVLRDGR